MTYRPAFEQLVRLVDDGASEQEVHAYLERHPHIIANCYLAYPPVLISKLRLGSDFVVDFAFMWSESGGHHLMLVEIERPTLKVFTKDDEFTSEFNHARQQVADWDAWAKEHRHEISRILAPIRDPAYTRPPSPITWIDTLLIAGRRSDVLANTRRQERWAHLVRGGPGWFVRTWDGFFERWGELVYQQHDYNEQVNCMRYRNQSFIPIADDEAGGSTLPSE